MGRPSFRSGVERRLTGPLTLFYRLDEEVPALGVIDLDDPDVRIDPEGALGIGVKVGLGLRDHRLHPDPLAIAPGGLAVEFRRPRPPIQNLDQHGAGPRVSFADHDGKGAALLGPANKGTHPDVR